MKFSYAVALAVVSFISGADAFTSPVQQQRNFALRMDNESTETVSQELSAQEPAVVDTPKPTLPLKSQSLPFMNRPMALDGTMVGDVGFDPLGFAKSKDDLFRYREAEIKHGRLAMLAAAGWPISELFDRKIANLIGAPAVVDATDRAPSLLNGGLGKISPVYWLAVLVAAGAIDLMQNDKANKNAAGYFAGNLGFDPLGLYPQDAAGQERMQLAELKNGRLGMIAITAFAFQEFVTSLGVVDETPMFFKPLGEVLHQQANAGYYIPN